jgi:DNA repair protein RadC
MILEEFVPKAQQIVTKSEFLKVTKDSVLNDRIREFGPEKLLNHEYLSIMTGIDAEKLRDYIWKYGITELPKVAEGLDITSQQRIRLLLLYEACRRISSESRNVVKVTSPDEASQLFMDRLRYHAVELLMVAYLDGRNHVILVKEMSRGSISETIVNHGMIIRDALNHSAVGVLLAHNHPSGDPSPSHNDKATTERLRDALKLVSISLLDHIIVGDNRFFSFKEQGLI